MTVSGIVGSTTHLY